MDEVETMDRLHKIIIDGVDLSLELVEVGRSSDSLYQATRTAARSVSMDYAIHTVRLFVK